MISAPLIALLIGQANQTPPRNPPIDGMEYLVVEAAVKDFRILKFKFPQNQIQNYTIDVEKNSRDYVVSFNPKRGPKDPPGGGVVGSITSLGLGMIFYVDAASLRVRKRTAMP